MSAILDLDAATRMILAYMTERNAWERAAWKQSRSARKKGIAADLESEAQIQAGYSELLARYCAPRVIALDLRYHYGDPPTVDPEQTRIISVGRTRGRLTIQTQETIDDGLGPATYVYELADVAGEMRLSERRLRTASGRSIRDVW